MVVSSINSTKSHESKIIEKEEFEINKADLIIVPSTFTYNGFIDYWG